MGVWAHVHHLTILSVGVCSWLHSLALEQVVQLKSVGQVRDQRLALHRIAVNVEGKLSLSKIYVVRH